MIHHMWGALKRAESIIFQLSPRVSRIGPRRRYKAEGSDQKAKSWKIGLGWPPPFSFQSYQVPVLFREEWDTSKTKYHMNSRQGQDEPPSAVQQDSLSAMRIRTAPLSPIAPKGLQLAPCILRRGRYGVKSSCAMLGSYTKHSKLSLVRTGATIKFRVRAPAS